MKLLKKFFPNNFTQKTREFIGLESPCLKYRELAKGMLEAAREGQEETYQVKRPTTNAYGR